METDRADPGDLAAIRAALAGGKPPLGWDALRAFETRNGIVVPEPYRTCVAEIADGAEAGPPGYGLIGLDDLPAWSEYPPARDLSRPFPLTVAWNWENDPRSVAETDPIVDRVHDHGSIVLGTDGCGEYWHLIVTGKHRGHMWSVVPEGAQPFGVEFGWTTAEPGFAGWVKHWAAGKDWFDAD